MSNELRVKTLTWDNRSSPSRLHGRAIYSLVNLDDSLYFVNDSKKTLKQVSTSSSGFIEEAALQNNPSYVYKDIQPNESVKVEQYNVIVDSDFVLGLDIYIETQNGTKTKIRASTHKGGVRPQVLLYEDLTTPRFANITKL